MVHGMSEDDVKKKLYGEFIESGDTEKDKPRPHGKDEVSVIKPDRKFPLIRYVCITGVVLAILVAFIIFLTAPRRGHQADSTSQQIKGYLVQGKKYYNDGLFDEAILTWKNILTIDPDNRSALRYIRRAELKKKELKIREEETARKLKEMLARKEKEEKERVMREREAQKKMEVRRLLKEADGYFREGKYSPAVNIYKKVLVLSPNNRHAIRYMSRAKKEMASISKREEPLPAKEEAGPLYTVQVATYLDIGHAEGLVNDLASKGYSSLNINKVKSKSGRVLYEVYIGSFTSKEEAAEIVEKVKKEGFKDSFIKTLKE